jgi:hypothetical protein
MQNQGNNQNLAAKIAELLEAESASTLSALRDSIEKLNRRLDKIESNFGPSTSAILPTLPSSAPVHPSQDRFAVIEAVVDEVFSQYKQEKACTFEPNGKPCDHCSMCSSRGF